jgi:hypothetical protein
MESNIKSVIMQLLRIIKDGYLYIPEEDDILFCDTINESFFLKIRLP